MLYPDLRRLPLLCPTGANNDHEASGSNDPPPQAGPAQRYALGRQDVVTAILSNLGGGNYEDACRVAARWCNLNSEHREACKADGPWRELTQAVFPHSRAPNPRDHEPTNPKDWFFYLCHRHARMAVLRDLVSRNRATRSYLLARQMRDVYRNGLQRDKRRRDAQRSRDVNELFRPGWSGLVTRAQVERWEKDLLRYTRDMQRYEAEGAVTWATMDDPEQWVGELAVLEAYMRGLYSEPS